MEQSQRQREQDLQEKKLIGEKIESSQDEAQVFHNFIEESEAKIAKDLSESMYQHYAMPSEMHFEAKEYINENLDREVHKNRS